MDFEEAAMWATRQGVDVAANVYGHGQALANDARQIARPVVGAVDATVDIASSMGTTALHQAEDGVAGAMPWMIDHGAEAARLATRPLAWGAEQAGRVAQGAREAFGWIAD